MSAEEAPVISRLSGFAWSDEETAAYEAAIEAVNAAVGAYSARIAAEESGPEPDAAVIEAAIRAQADLARRREALDPADHARIAAARAQFTELAATIRKGTG